MRTSDLFDLKKMRDEGRDWRFEAFQRAHTSLADSPAVAAIKRGALTPFDRVLDRLRLGYSALVRLPGNCMVPAARMVREKVGNEAEWEEHGRPTQEGGVKFSEIWGRVPGVFTRIFARLTKPQTSESHVIVHNLEDLADSNGLLHDESVYSAFNALREATRLGRVFAMADRESSRLPDQLLQLFPEKAIDLDAIDADRFLNIVPRSLGRWFSQGDEVNETALRLIAMRLRYIDPIRAVRAMDDAGMKAESWPADEAARRILEELWRTTQALGYVVPSESVAVSTERGFEPATVAALKNVARRYGEIRELCLRPPTARGASSELESAFETLQKGVLLHGPTGTGKTHLARWLARELDLPMRIITAADIRASDWGRAEQIVHSIFREARRAAPCVLMFDEADDLFPDRDDAMGSVAGAERALVTATLQELDGLFGPLNGVLVLMTSNRKGAMDKAIRGRLTRRLLIPYPETPEQVALIVDNLADTMRLDLSGMMTPTADWGHRFGFPSKYTAAQCTVRDALIERFFLPVTFAGQRNLDTPAGRRKAPHGLFAPREMREAMSELIAPENRTPTGVRPTQADVERVFASYGSDRDDDS